MISYGANPERTILAVVLAMLLAYVAVRARALTCSGGLAALCVGTVVVSGSSWWAGTTLIVFFTTSTALSKLRASKSSRTRQQRGSQRDAIQVLANGGIPAAFSLIALSSGSSIWTLGVFCAIAAATADTWATEIGRLTQSIPRSIISMRRVAIGTSGAVSLPGSAASLAGGLLIGGLAATGIGAGWLDTTTTWMVSLAVVATAGCVGSILDSFLGAIWQESRFCDVCNEVTESPIHDCGSITRKIAGITGFNNDVVNVASVSIPALLAIVAVYLIQ